MPNEMIYTVKAGTPVNVTIDNKPEAVTFGHSMKLVSSSTLLNYEKMMNNNILKNIKVTKKQAGWTGAITSILGIVGYLLKRRKKA